MMIIKYIFGALGVLFALFHLIEILHKLANGTHAGDLAVSMYMGHVTGICIGIIVAVVCFRSKKS